MNNLHHPSELNSLISEDVLCTISDLMLDVAHTVKIDLKHQDDSAYTRQCTLFGRLHKALLRNLPQISHVQIQNSTMEFTFTLGGCVCRFDSSIRNKAYAKACKISPLPTSQIDMFPIDNKNLAKAVFQICSHKNDQDHDLDYYVIFHGYNLVNQKISEWSSHPKVTAMYSLAEDAPKSANLDPAHVEAREEPLSDSKHGGEENQDFDKQDFNG